jgi:hypothetical protein
MLGYNLRTQMVRYRSRQCLHRQKKTAMSVFVLFMNIPSACPQASWTAGVFVSCIALAMTIVMTTVYVPRNEPGPIDDSYIAGAPKVSPRSTQTLMISRHSHR